MADAREIFLIAALDQLQKAIQQKNAGAAEAIILEVQRHYPHDADTLLRRLIAAGLRRAGG